MSGAMLMWLAILVPLAAGALVLAVRNSFAALVEKVAVATAAVTVGAAILLFRLPKEATLTLPWAGCFEFALRAYNFSTFIVLAASCFGLAIAWYCRAFLRGRAYGNRFYAFLLITMGMVNGAVLANHLVTLLFFWEGLLVTMFCMIALGSPGAFRTATKAFIIVGVTDLCMMLGIALTGELAGTLTMSRIHLPATGLGAAAMVLLLIGAMAKSGSMPFHSWIPDAAVDAPLPFMAFLPASIEKLVGIYMTTRIAMDLFAMDTHSWISMLLMSVGAVTIVLAVMMALVQKDYKKLLSYHAISQVGYMILGIGTAVPAGIVGGLFHMLNNALYKSALFLTGGAVEKQAGTTDLNKLGGLARRMPVTCACFIVAAVSISGVPPFNGFFSKEILYDAALERNVVFYLAAVVGSFFTAASFLKLGHAAYFDRRNIENTSGVKEAPVSMLVPMVALAGCCILFGVWNEIPLRQFIQPVLGEHRLEGHDFAGWPKSVFLTLITMLVLVAAVVNHVLGARAAGSGLGASNHIHHAPRLEDIYARAEKGSLDPFRLGMYAATLAANMLWAVDRGIDWLYNRAAVVLGRVSGSMVTSAHNGEHARYIVWALLGAAATVCFLLKMR